jgi:peptidoglycan/xylan/chitin deacetylase (PgdA/CDA1 family)
MMFSKQTLIGATLPLLARAKIPQTWAGRIKGRGVILTFHHVRPERESGFSPNALLEVTPEFLKTILDVLEEIGFSILLLDDVPHALQQEGPPFAVLTFDDGYRDNRDHAWPILKARDCPWTVFVTTDFASGRGRLWWRELEEVIRRQEVLELSEPSLPSRLALRTDKEKKQVFQILYWHLRHQSEEHLRTFISRLAQNAGINPDHLVQDACLTWDELKALARDPLITFGAHTLTHPMLAKHNEDCVRHEMRESQRIIEEKLNVPVRHFAYPVGDPTSAGTRDFSLAKESGFTTAVTTRPGPLFPEHQNHLHALPRISMNGLYQTPQAVRALLSGLPFLFWNRGRKVNVA